MFRKPQHLTPLIALILISGCDDRVTQVAREAADRQAQQNTEMARLNKEVAAGGHQLVEADARARKEIVGVHHDLQAERQRLASGWDALEVERQRIAGERRTESFLASASNVLGAVLVVALLLGFSWYALFASRHGNVGDSELHDLMINEILSGESHDDYALVIGLRNSHDKSFPASIALGSSVFVCDNLAFSAEVTIARRHTRFIERDLPRIVHTAVGRLADMRGHRWVFSKLVGVTWHLSIITF